MAMTYPQMFHRQRPLRTLLIWLVLACLLPSVAGVLIFFIHEYQITRSQLERDTLQTARALGQAVDNHFLRVQALAQSLATSDSLLRGDLSQFHRQASAALRVVGLGSNVVLRDAEGRQLLNTAVPLGLRLPVLSEADQVASVYRTAMPTISDVVSGPVMRRPLISIDVPVLDGKRVIYALGVGVTSERINSILQSQGLPQGWVASVLDRNGVIAARTHLPQTFVGQKAQADFIQKAQGRQQGSMETTSKEGNDVVTVFARSPVTGFTVAIGIPRQAIISPLVHNLVLLGIAVILLFGIGLAVAHYTGRRIAQSMQALIAPAMALGRGEPLPASRVQVAEAAAVRASLERASALLQQRAEHLRAKEEDLQQFKFFSDHASDLHLLLDDAGRIRYANRMACERLGYPEPELLALNLTDLDTPVSLRKLRDLFSRCRSGHIAPFERTYRCKDGSALPVEVSATVLEHRGEWLMFAAARDITERKHAEKEIRRAALHDVLTGLPNRALVMEYCEHLLAASHRRHGQGALLFIDLDRFKPINDLHGHEIGDRVLQEVARRLVQCTRHEDLVGRLGGDEFVILLPHLDGTKQRAATVAQHVISSVSAPMLIHGLELSVSPSIGISFMPDDASDVSALVHTADVAMYHAKEGGRANFRFYSPEMEESARRALTVEMRLRDALHQGGLELYFQPVIEISSGALTGVEALLRLSDARKPPFGPDIFIPVAEATGLIGDIGDWVAMQACRQQARWLEQGLMLAIGINVSPLQFRRPGFADRLKQIIVETGVDPACLIVEVTETAVMEDFSTACAILDDIKKLGVKVALDDFGTGYSSLSRLSTLPLDKLKVDQSFVRRIESDHASRAVIDAVLALAHSLALVVVAEGVEGEAALQYLHERGCHQGQGYWFSRPLSITDFMDWQVWRQGGTDHHQQSI